MKKRINVIVAITLMLLLSAGQLPLLAAARERGAARRLEPLKVTRTSKRQDPVQLPRPAGESMTLLPDGRILLVGGESASGPSTSAEIRDDRTGAVTRLADSMRTARSWHTATVLPDGLVFIFGGVGSGGEILAHAELFDPENNSFQVLPPNTLKPRAHHTATLLTDGRVLLAGGTDARGANANKLASWDNETKTARVLKAQLTSGRQKAKASLQSDGTIFITAGSNETETQVTGSEVYDPDNDVLTWVPGSDPIPDEPTARLAFSSPADGTVDVDPKTRIAVRFSRQLQADTVNRETVKLLGPTNEVPAKIVSAENGRLVFITPLAPLAAATSYHVKIDGPLATDKQKLELATFGFKTKGESQNESENCQGQHCHGAHPVHDADTWIPSPDNFRGNWSSGRREVPAEIPPLQAATGETALTGQVLALSGSPIARVVLQVGDRTAATDSTGRFLLTGIPSGRQVLTIQGHTASRPGKQYGTFDVQVDVVAGKTTALDYKIWLPVLDEQSAVTLPLPTHRELGVTTPRVPGMEVRIPANSVLRMPHGAHGSHGMSRRELTSLAITPIPSDRTPFPLPQGVNDALVFTLQLHGAKVEGFKGEKRPGLRIVYPNYLNLPAGDRVEFWNYEPVGAGWYKYGHGTVTPDRRQVIPDPGVELQSMYCISLMVKFGVPALWPIAFAMDSDPVDLGTGLFVYNKTDLVLPDVMPIELSRTYRQNDTVERPFGKGMMNPYDIYIAGSTHTYGEIVLPDAARIRLDVVSQSEFTYECNTSPTKFYKSTMRRIAGVGPNGAWEVRLKDGTIYQFGIKVLWGDIFGPHHTTTALSTIIDRYGNKLTITRDNDFRISRVTSPNGRWIQFSYSDSSVKIAQATDNSGRTISYTYDAGGRLWKVTDAKGGVTEYLYDSSDRMLSIKNPRNIIYVTNEYDPVSGRVTRQTLADDGVYQFAYTVDSQGKITQTDVTDPRNHIRRTTFNSSGYEVSDTLALGTPQQQTYTYERAPGSNFMLGVVDPMGRRTAMTYDPLGNLTSVTRLAGTENAITSSITYEPVFQQVATITDPLDHTTTYEYAPDGLLASIKDALNKVTTFTYNPAGQMLTATDSLDRTVRFGYDAGDLVSVTDPLNRTVTRYVDGAGRPTRATNPLGGSTRAEFDAVNQTTQFINANGEASSISYDPNGNILSVTDARNNATTYVYDDMDRVAIVRDPLQHDETYEYDLNGNLSRVTDRKNQLTNYAYDALDRLSLVTYADGSTTTFTYDSGGRLTQIADSLGGLVTYGYDDLDRLTSKITPEGTITYTYDAAGRQTSMTVAGQPTVNYTYDNGDRLIQITQGTQTVTMAYDDIGRRTSLTLPNNVVTEYGYDQASQLTSLTYKHNGNVMGDLTYEYDAVGRRTKMGGSFARSVLPQTVSSATYNAANQLLTFGERTLTYDLNGSLTNDGENTYTWDARNRLTNVNGPGVIGSFAYSAGGGRSSSTINGITTSFLRTGGSVVQRQLSGSGATNILGGGGGEIFTRSDSSGTYSQLFDGLGNSLAELDGSGAVKAEYSHGPFGQEAVSGSPSDGSSQYAGGENDGSGLQYNNGAYYSPEQQRLISEGSGGNNQYAVSAPDPNAPRSFLNNPFPVDYVLGNAASNTLNDLLMGDSFAGWAHTWANPCLPASERMIAGGKIIAMAALLAGGGIIARGAARGIGALAKLLKGTSVIDDLAAAATRAANKVGAGKGPVHGTKVHTAFEAEVNALGRSNLTTEVSYLNGKVVPRGTKGSVRLDVVEGPLDAPKVIYDLKTGSATLSTSRISDILSHLPGGGNGVPVIVVRP